MCYEQQVDGEWVDAKKRGYRLMCCDCGLTHVFDFKTIKTGRGIEIRYRVRRNNRATAAARRGKAYRKNKIYESD